MRRVKIGVLIFLAEPQKKLQQQVYRHFLTKCFEFFLFLFSLTLLADVKTFI